MTEKKEIKSWLLKKIFARINKESFLHWSQEDKITFLEKQIEALENKIKWRHDATGDAFKDAKIVCTTLSMSGGKFFVSHLKNKIDYLIVDEACQSIEPETLIPF